MPKSMNKLLYLIILIGLFSSCSFNKKYKEYIIKNLSNSISDTLIFDKNISKIEILIEGNIQGEAILEIENGSNRFHQIKLENKINYIYETEWYNPKLFFRYNPNGNISGGNLSIKYIGY